MGCFEVAICDWRYELVIFVRKRGCCRSGDFDLPLMDDFGVFAIFLRFSFGDRDLPLMDDFVVFAMFSRFFCDLTWLLLCGYAPDGTRSAKRSAIEGEQLHVEIEQCCSKERLGRR